MKFKLYIQGYCFLRKAGFSLLVPNAANPAALQRCILQKERFKVSQTQFSPGSSRLLPCVPATRRPLRTLQHFYMYHQLGFPIYQDSSSKDALLPFISMLQLDILNTLHPSVLLVPPNTSLEDTAVKGYYHFTPGYSPPCKLVSPNWGKNSIYLLKEWSCVLSKLQAGSRLTRIKSFQRGQATLGSRAPRTFRSRWASQGFFFNDKTKF